MFLQWSDDLVSGLSSTAIRRADIQVTMDAFAAYTAYTMDMIAKRGPSRPTTCSASWSMPRSRVSGCPTTTDRHRDAADPDRRRRDHPAHAVRRHRAAVASPRSVPAPGRPTRTCCRARSRRCCAGPSPVKNMCRTLTADTEFHGTQLNAGREDDADVRVGQLRRDRLRRPGQLQHRPVSEQPLGVWLRHAFLPRQSAGPARAVA